MITISRRAAFKGATAAGSVLAAAALVAACSSSSKSSSPASTGAAGSGGSGAAAATVETHSGPLGTFLTTSSGKSLYVFASDTATKSNCSGGCASFWPPLTVKGTPTVSGDAQASITTLTRSDGSKQVVYNGHPLYTYLEDTKAGDTNGQGSDNFGAKWWLLAPSGQPIEGSGSGSASSPSSSSPSSSSPSSSSAGGGGGGWA